jgi:hypothetical protein
MHLVWMSIFVPGALFVVWSFPARRQPNIWLVVLGIAIAGLAVVIGFDLFEYFTKRGGQLPHGFMRAVFAVIMSTDFPLVALAVGGFTGWMLTSGKRRSIDRAGSDEPNASAKQRSPEESEVAETINPYSSPPA